MTVRSSASRGQSLALFSVRVFPVDLLTTCSLVQAGQNGLIFVFKRKSVFILGARSVLVQPVLDV
jgi:hypothetical protein